jgi:hsp70-interacting protein
MADPVMNNLLRWGIENSEASKDDNAPAPARTALDPAALQAFFGGMKSDADVMKDSMNIIEDADSTVEQKEVAFEDFEMLIEGIDNANNIENLGLWSRLVDKFSLEEASLRKWAAWCAGTAVENNPKAQERVRQCLCTVCTQELTFIVTRNRWHPCSRQACNRRRKRGRSQEGCTRSFYRLP